LSALESPRAPTPLLLCRFTSALRCTLLWRVWRVPSLTSRWATGVVDQCFSSSTRGSTKVGLCICTTGSRGERIRLDGPTATSLIATCRTTIRNTALEHFIWTTYLLLSNATVPCAKILTHPNSAKATKSCDHCTKHLPSAIPTDPKQPL
jgi:hypothetical protein